MLKMPRIIINILIIFCLSIYSVTLFNFPVYSNELTDLEQEITQKEQEIKKKESILSSVESRIKEISNSNYSISQKITMLNEEISLLEKNIADTEVEISAKVLAIEEKQAQLEGKKVLIDEVSGDLYMQSRYKLANFFLNKDSWKDLVEGIYIRKSTITMLRSEVEKIGGEFSSLAESKADLDRQKEGLDSQREGLDEAYELLANEKSKLQSELSKQVAAKSGLSSEITDLTKKVSQLQSALIASRSAGFISSGGTTSWDLSTSISNAPSGYFGVFSIGAYTHRNGMSQWGARARADIGKQSYEDILKAYYPSAVLSKSYTEPVTIIVRGTGDSCTCQLWEGANCKSYSRYYDEPVDFSVYMNRIFEMPPSWNVEAVKAQAIASRSYAIAQHNAKGFIQPSQSGQVYKDCDNTQDWKNAVNNTVNQVLTVNSSAYSSQFAAVHGGWVNNNVGWDTQSGGGSNWFNDAWDKLSEVTWFYKSWYRQDSSSSGTDCGHSPWLSPQEMIDIVNAYLIKNDIGLSRTPDKSRLLPSDYGLCSGRIDYTRVDKVPYNSSELKSFLSSPVISISSVSPYLQNGWTVSVTFHTNRGDVPISGLGFKDIYNQMAPGHMRIQQKDRITNPIEGYEYFNIERK